MSTDLEADLRREFDAVGAPSGLTFSPDSVVRKGKRTILRRRIIAGGSAAIAVVLAVTGASLLTRPHDTAAPLPASHKATTGIVRAQAGFSSGTAQVELNRDVSVESNVKYSYITLDGVRHDVGASSTGKPGQKPDATWRSAMVDGHPVTIGLVPSPARNLEVTFAGSPNGISVEDLKGTGYAMFAVDYTLSEKVPPNTAVSGPVINGPRPQEATRTSQIASISWSGPTGIVDGIAGDQRLTGRVLNIDKSVAVKVVLRPGDGGPTTVSGQVWIQIGGGASSYSSFLSLSVATTDPSGAAVVTGRQPIVGVNHVGPPIAAGILPPGSSGIGVILTTDAVARPVIVSKRLNDGRVIFALKVASTKATDLGKDSIKAVTWTNADGTKGRMNVTQKQS
jgi:hypothetical protein